MAESSMRKVGHITKDIISDLPRNIHEHILGFLPIQDAVKTSTLSRKWRHCWTTIPHLIFDDESLYSMWDEESKSHERRELMARWELRAHKFVSVIDKVLLLHNGPIIKFSLACPEDYYAAHIIHDNIDKWLTLLSKNGIKQLTLQKYMNSRVHDFSSLDLTHLRLIGVWFPYIPASGGFSYMTSLELIHVYNSAQSIFYCPVLEKLTLISCEKLFPTNFCAPKLKCLHQIYRKFTFKCSAAGLENLTEYSYYLLEDPITQTETSNVVKVVGSLHKIEKFSAGRYFIKYLATGGSPNRLSKPLPYLKTLNISEINLTDLSEVSCLLCLIRSAPNLCKLHISLIGKTDLKNYWIEEVSEDCTSDHLEIVTFSFFKGLTAEMELVKFLLAHSPLLKTMFIHRSDDIKRDAALTMAEKMVEYSRASSRAQIKYLKNPVVIEGIDMDLWDHIG